MWKSAETLLAAAFLGGALAIGGVGGLTLGTIVAFLQLSRSFTMPISQVSQQINSVVSAMAVR